MGSRQSDKPPALVRQLTDDAVAALEVFKISQGSGRSEALAHVTAVLKARSTAMEDLVTRLQQAARQACRTPNRPFSSKQSCCSFFDGIATVLVPTNFLKQHPQLAIGHSSRLQTLADLTWDLVESIVQPQNTVLTDPQCIESWTRVLTAGRTMLQHPMVSRNILQLMLPVLLLPEVQQHLQGTGLVNSIASCMKNLPGCHNAHEVALQALINLTAGNEVLMKELQESSNWLHILARGLPHTCNPPPSAEVSRLAFKLAEPVIRKQMYIQLQANPVFGEDDARALKAWGSSVKQHVLRATSGRPTAAVVAMDDIYKAADMLQVGRRGLVNALKRRIMILSSAGNMPGSSIVLTANQGEAMGQLAMFTFISGGMFGGCRGNFITKAYLQSEYWTMRYAAKREDEWLASLYADWAMEHIYEQLVRASKAEARSNPSLAHWEQQLAKALIFNDNGALLRFTLLPEVTTGDVTAWVKELVQLDMQTIAPDSGDVPATVSGKQQQPNDPLSLNVDRRLMRLLVFAELAFRPALEVLDAAKKKKQGVEEDSEQGDGRACSSTTACSNSTPLSPSGAASGGHSKEQATTQSSAQDGETVTTNVEVCAACGEPAPAGKKLKNCAGCVVTMYCSRECQEQHWKRHRAFCKVLQGKRTMSSVWEKAASQAAQDLSE